LFVDEDAWRSIAQPPLEGSRSLISGFAIAGVLQF
jgi:hypothetical protein